METTGDAVIPLERRLENFISGSTVIKAKAYITDRDFGYDRWVADEFSCGKGTNDAFMVILPTNEGGADEESGRHQVVRESRKHDDGERSVEPNQENIPPRQVQKHIEAIQESRA